MQVCVMAACLILMTSLVHDVTGAAFTIPQELREKNINYWYDLGRKEIEEAMAKPVNLKVAKNVILFLGDGMGITTSTAGRIYKGQMQGHSGEEGYLAWERLPNVGLIKTYDLDKQVPDSASTATAFVSGVKTNYYTLGVSGKVKMDDCRASLDPDNWVSTILTWAQKAGKDTGMVTTTRITHATPAATYAHTPQRDWECDSEIPDADRSLGCKDIARQLMEDEPGSKVNVIFGGGSRVMGVSVDDPDQSDDTCFRKDGRNLVDDWVEAKRSQKQSYVYVTDAQQLSEADVGNTDFVLGLFSESHMPFETFRKNMTNVPSLKDMTLKALERLENSEDGYFLLVEGGRIDSALHYSKPRLAMDEILAFDEAIAAALERVDEEETLVVVTADHSHVLTINGYPDRGNDILGLATSPDVTDGLPYTTLMFTNGFGSNYTWNGEKVVRSDVRSVDTRGPNFIAQSAIPMEDGSETHGGEDVAVFATGPMAHLFHRVHEQSYIAHVMASAACIGMYESCDRPTNN